MTHQIDFRVYYEDTDAGGIVYNGNYLRFAERARTEWLRELGFTQSNLPVLFVVRKVEIDFLSPAKLDDLVTVKTSLQNISRASITLEQNFYVGEKQLARIIVVIVSVSREEFRPVSLPEDIKAKIQLT